MPREPMNALVFNAEEPGEPECYLVDLTSALPNVWRNLQNNSAQGKRKYSHLGCENTDGLLTEEEEEDEDAVNEVLDWIKGLCIADNKFDVASDGRVRINNCVTISIRAD